MKELINNNVDKGKFHFTVPLHSIDGKVNIIEKSIKNKDGSEIKVKRLYGEASNNYVDKADERVSKSFIKKMLTSLNGLNVFVDHDHFLEKTIGVISETDGTDEHVNIYTDLESEDNNPLVKSILSKAEHGINLYYSIWGRITKAIKSYDEELKKNVTELMDGEIYEVSVTPLPEGNVSAASVISKSMKDAFPDEFKDKENAEEFEDTQDIELISKALAEMVESEQISDQMRNLYWAYTSGIYKITNDESLTPEEKKTKIMNFSSEYGDEIQKLATTLASLTQTIESQLSGDDNAS